MNLILHEMAHSPYCIPVKRILEAYSVPFETADVSNWDRRELARLTGGAYYQVPVLEYDGKVIHELPSDPLAVPRFLDQEFAGGNLFPEHCAGIHEILIDQVEDGLEGKGFKIGDPEYVDAISDIGEKAMVIRHKERKFGVGCVEEWRKNGDALFADFQKALEPYDAKLAHSRYLFGERPVYADFALFGVIGNVKYSGTRLLDDRLKNIKRWLADLEQFSA